MAKNKVAGSGISFFGLLAIVFITLKLCGVISWSWWLVLMPLWAIPACVLFVMLCVFCFAVLAGLGDRV